MTETTEIYDHRNAAEYTTKQTLNTSCILEVSKN